MLAAFLVWLILIAAASLFVFAYPRFLFAPSPPQASRPRSAAIFHGVAAAIAASLFVIWSLQLWPNPLAGESDWPVVPIALLAAIPLFLVSALALLLKGRSTLAPFASILFWPYLLTLALSFASAPWFIASALQTCFSFLCLLSTVLFAFAAGAVSYRPAIAHCAAVAGLLATPWIYWTALHDRPLGNIWTALNVPGPIPGPYDGVHVAELAICSIAFVVLAISTAALRLLPARWAFRGSPVAQRTWPAFCAAFLFLAVWFSQSVMPYRISGAVDYDGWPVLQILHVEKRGLQFHELCISVWGRGNYLQQVSFSGNDRHLFEYRFQQQHSSGELSDSLKTRIQSEIDSLKGNPRYRDTVKPLRSWNDDGWYVQTQTGGRRAYTKGNATNPPQDIVDLFNELRKTPQASETHEERKDVCLGFCYDPLSALGFLYANQRCGYDDQKKTYVCR